MDRIKVLYYMNSFGRERFIVNQITDLAVHVNAGVLTTFLHDVTDDVRMLTTIIPRRRRSFISKIQEALEFRDIKLLLRDRAFASKARQYIEIFCPDIIHCQFGYDALFLLSNVYSPSCLYIIHFRGFDASSKLNLGIYRQRLSRFMSRPNVFPIFVCKSLRDNLRRANITFSNIHAVVYSNTDTDFFRRRSHHHSRNQLKFLQVSNFREKKGHYQTIKAFELFALRNPDQDFRLTFIGTKDGHFKRVEAMAKHSAICDKIELINHLSRERVRDIMEHSHYFVHHSQTARDGDQEGIPNSIMEAMAMELPILSTAHSGIPELLMDNEDVLLAHEGNVMEYVENIEHILNRSYSKKNRDRIIAQFSRERFLSDMMAFYTRVLSQRFVLQKNVSLR